MIALAETLPTSPEVVLQWLADTTLTLCGAHSAGLCLLDEKETFRWRAMAGQWTPYLGDSAPRDFSPCGMVLDRNAPLLFTHPERDFPFLGEVTPLMDEGLSVPFYVHGEAVGTIWAISHDESRRFDAEHLRMMTNLGAFVAAAFQTSQSNNAGGPADRESRYLAAAVGSCGDAMVTCDMNGVITTWNEAATALYGYTAEEAIGRPLGLLFPPGRTEEYATIQECVSGGRRIGASETVHRRKDGTLIDIAVTTSPILDARNQIVGTSRVARDISAHRAALEQQNRLIEEMSHRIKNLFAIASSVVTMSARFAPSPQSMARAVEERFAALRRAHDLTRPGITGGDLQEPSGTTLHDIVRTVFSPFVVRSATDRDRISIAGQDVAIGRNCVTNVALILHELTTNAAKYGALASPEGTVHVEWSIEGDELTLTWTEHGGPPIDDKSGKEGFGYTLIDGVMRGAFGGRFSRDWQRGGLVVRLSLPARALDA